MAADAFFQPFAYKGLTLPNRAVWCFTGNNVTLKNDLRRRFITIRMVPRTSAPHEEHKTRNIDTWPVEHRVEMLKALISILMWASKETIKLSTESGFSATPRPNSRAKARTSCLR